MSSSWVNSSSNLCSKWEILVSIPLISSTTSSWWELDRRNNSSSRLFMLAMLSSIEKDEPAPLEEPTFYVAGGMGSVEGSSSSSVS